MHFKQFSLWPDHRTVWRWHFFAGLFCLPFVAFLSLTGSVYLFKPQIDDWIDWRFDHLSVTGPAASPTQEVRAALAAVPGGRLLAYELPRGVGSAARVVVDHGGETIRVYVDPSSLSILKKIPEESRFERIVFKLHGQLLLGNVGSVIMEMVASWTIVMIVTGIYLWWPRGGARGGGVLYPRVGRARARWRDLHAVTGLWISLFLALFLVSGLPWSFVWGHALARVETTVGKLTSVQDWEIGAISARDVIVGHPAENSGAIQRMPGMDMGDMDMPGMDMARSTTAISPSADPLAGLDAVVIASRRLGFPAPVLVTPPARIGAPWRVRSDTPDRPRRVSALLDAKGAVLSMERFSSKGVADRVVAYGVAAHEGQLFGWANQVLNLLVATGLLTMSVAATILWLRRKTPGHLGAPSPLASQRVGVGSLVVMTALGVLLPELGASLLLIVVASVILKKT
ncbi:PepSY domain-containing protein [Acetobacter sp. DsW_063]|uniref:PepSY-associated TM helix domain-containing protein n=1 Tax=Acetobacter sp. DsW_063 TaxID=1514894 RepID=UPI000A3C8E85|nr:PepSY domain-containing protein [Acetobacter sp. DsW_063]